MHCHVTSPGLMGPSAWVTHSAHCLLHYLASYLGPTSRTALFSLPPHSLCHCTLLPHYLSATHSCDYLPTFGPLGSLLTCLPSLILLPHCTYYLLYTIRSLWRYLPSLIATTFASRASFWDHPRACHLPAVPPLPACYTNCHLWITSVLLPIALLHAPHYHSSTIPVLYLSAHSPCM